MAAREGADLKVPFPPGGSFDLFPTEVKPRKEDIHSVETETLSRQAKAWASGGCGILPGRIKGLGFLGLQGCFARYATKYPK